MPEIKGTSLMQKMCTTESYERTETGVQQCIIVLALKKLGVDLIKSNKKRASFKLTLRIMILGR